MKKKRQPRRAVAKQNFTKRALEALDVPASGHTLLYDTQTRGLGIKVESGSGSKTYFWYRKVRRYPTWYSIGRFPELSIEDARQHADERNAKLSKWKLADFAGPSPFERPDVLTLDNLVEEYIVKRLRGHAKRPDAAEHRLRWFVKRYFTSLRERPIASIRYEDVAQLHHKISKTHKTQANITVSWLSILFNFARKARIYTGENPAHGHMLNAKVERERFLQPDELAKLGDALRHARNLDLKDFVELSLWTGARKMDVLSMRWQDVSLTGDNRWTIPNPKNRKPHTVPLTDEALAILRERLSRAEHVERERGVARSAYVFPSYGKHKHIAGMQRAWATLLHDAGLDYEDTERQLHIHDLRRSSASYMAAQGSSLLVVGKMLGHSSSASTEIYAKLLLAPVRAEMQKAQAAMRALMLSGSV